MLLFLLFPPAPAFAHFTSLHEKRFSPYLQIDIFKQAENKLSGYNPLMKTIYTCVFIKVRKNISFLFNKCDSFFFGRKNEVTLRCKRG